MDIEQNILELLKTKQPMKAKDILIALGNDLTTKDINAVLYGKLKGKVVQDKNYRWSLKGNSANQESTDTIPDKQDTELAKLSSYYLECISKDIDNGISEYASSKYQNLDYSQLEAIPFLESSSEEFNLDSISYVTNKVRRDKNRLVLKIGYPIYLRQYTSKAGNHYYKVEPLFLLSIDTDLLLSNNQFQLTDEDPSLNPEVIRKVLGVNSSELMQEILLLNDELGISSDDAKPSLDDLSQRLQMIRSGWEWVEEIDPFNLSATDLSQTTKQGIYNSCGVFVSERSQFTIGLEKELTELTRVSKTRYSTSALGQWVDYAIGSSTISNDTLLEPLSLNEEQREAILRGLSAQLTVVTGPPGTGKSQVVASLLINAVFNGQKVLFASKNNKAVDVVFERINGLTSRPVMLRLGNLEFQASLANYLTDLLTSRTSENDVRQFQEAKQRHVALSSSITEIKKKQEHLVFRRNTLDRIEESIEGVRNEIGSEIFAHTLKTLSLKN